MKLRKYATQDSIDITAYDILTGQIVVPSFVTGDVKISKDGAGMVNTANLPVANGYGWSLTLSATELTAKCIRLEIIDQTNPKIWLDIAEFIETYGNASAQHPDLAKELNNLSSANVQAACDAALDAFSGFGNGATADQVWDEAIEDTVSARQIQMLILALIAGLSSGATGSAGTISLKNIAGTKTRVSKTVDAHGNCTSVTVDFTT